ncbi:hypothetical protein L1887_01789 [Cichorium endivia]|nr:hypothetical protein L1887_01789 [Cichorium endivia]
MQHSRIFNTFSYSSALTYSLTYIFQPSLQISKVAIPKHKLHNPPTATYTQPSKHISYLRWILENLEWTKVSGVFCDKLYANFKMPSLGQSSSSSVFSRLQFYCSVAGVE